MEIFSVAVSTAASISIIERLAYLKLVDLEVAPMPGRFADCEIMASESVALIDREVSDGARKVERDHNKVVTVVITVKIKFNTEMGEPLPEFDIESTSSFLKRRCFGLIRGSRLTLPGTEVLSDMEPDEMDESADQTSDREPSRV